MDWSQLDWKHEDLWWVVVGGATLLAVGQVLLFAWRRGVRERIGDRDLVARLTETTSRPLQVTRAVLAVVALALVLLTLLRPQYGMREDEVLHRGVDVAVLLDASQSMLVRDVAPDRFAASKQEIVKILRGLRGGRAALIPFYFFPFVQSPLTSDTSALVGYLDELALRDIAPPEMRGTSLGRALSAAVAVLNRDEQQLRQVTAAGPGPEAAALADPAAATAAERTAELNVRAPKGSKYKAIVMFTDGEENEAVPEDLLEAARAAGIRIYPVGVGTRAGHVVPSVTDEGQVTGVLKREGDEPVFSAVNEELLRGLADATGGQYFPFANRSVAPDVVAALDALEKKQYEAQLQEAGEDRFQFVLLPALLLLMLEAALPDRRRRRPRREAGGPMAEAA
jgi:Ca-activated chloride channel family protein